MPRVIGIPCTKTIRLWVKRYHEHGRKGLEERRGTSKSPFKGRPRKKECSLEEENRRLKAEAEAQIDRIQRRNRRQP